MEHIHTDIRESCGIITINRPEAMNALTPASIEGIERAVVELSDAEDVRAIIITGMGEAAFAAGCDIHVLATMGPHDIQSFIETGHRCMRAIEACPRPVIAAVHGHALGGGFELVLACDLAIASEGATFGFPEVKLGIIPGFGGTQRLPRRVGTARAKELILTGHILDARTAAAWGIVNRMVTQGDLMNEATSLATTLAEGSAHAQGAAKKAINQGIEVSLDEGMVKEHEQLLDCFGRPDARTAFSTFLHRRRSP